MAFEDINWGMAAPVNVGGALMAGVEQGRAMRKEADTQNALAAYATNPTLQSANALIAVDPRLGMQARTQQIEMDKTAQERAAIVAATAGGAGEHPSVGALVKMGVPYETARQINDDHIKEVGKAADFLGQVGLRVTATPEADRTQVWQAAVAQAQALGIPVPPEFAQYSPAALDGVLSASEQMKEAIGLTDPKYQAVPGQGGYLENVNLRSRTTPIPTGPESAPIQAGAVVNGKKFRGGDYRDPANWEAEGGPTHTTSGGFPGVPR